MGIIKRQGIKNTIITYIGIAIGAVNIVFIQPKLLNPEELGLTRLLYDFSYFVGLAVPLGLPNIIVRYFPFFRDADKRHNGFAGFVLLVFCIGFILSTCILLLLKPVITDSYIEKSRLFVEYFLFIIPFTFIVSAITVTTSYCQALFKSTVPSFLNDICLRLGTILVTTLYFNKWISFDQYIYCFIGLYAIQLVMLVGYILLVDRVSFKLSRSIFASHGVKTMMRFGLLLSLASFASIALRKIDTLFLGTLSLNLVAVYTTAVFIASFIEVPLGALERISHTKIADNFSKNNLVEIEKIYKDSVKYLLVIGGLLFVGITTCTQYVYEISGLPPEYTQCIDVVYIVSIGALVNISTGVNSAIVFYSNQYMLGTALLFLTLVITIVLNVILIPLYGIYGAAMASASGAFIYNLVKFIFIYKKFKFQPYTTGSLGIFLVILVCTLISYLLPDMGKGITNLLIKGAIVSAVYISAIYLFKLSPEIFNVFLRRLKNSKGDT